MIGFEVETNTSLTKAKFDHFPAALRNALVPHVERYAIFLQSYIRSNKLSGDPLHRRTGNLSASINYKSVVQTENSVETAVGTNLSYGRVHELGGTFEIPAYTRTSSKGNDYLVRQHSATYPKRAFLSPSMQETAGKFVEEIEAAVKETVGS